MIASQLYLIAHKVRGEPAFDVAIQMEMADGLWWIIPTSGHRAYPYWHEPLESGDQTTLDYVRAEMPEGHPDHYPAAQRAAPSRPSVNSIPRLEDI